MDAQLKAQLQETIGYKTVTGRGAGGDPTYSVAGTLSARVVEDQREVPGGGGKMVVTTHQIVTEDILTLDHRIWLPGENTSTDPPRIPQHVQIAKDEYGDEDYCLLWV